MIISNGTDEISFKDSHSCIITFNEDHEKYWFTTDYVYDILLKVGQEAFNCSSNSNTKDLIDGGK